MNKKALLIVDVQKAFDDKKWGKRNNLDAEENILKLLNFFREENWPIIYIKHLSDNPASLFYPENKGFEIKEIVKPEEKDLILTKKVNSSFIGTNLENILREQNIDTVVITGLTTPHCISTTTRMSGNLGFLTYLVSDATAAFGLKDHNQIYHSADTIHELSLATLHEEFAEILLTEELIKEMTASY